MALTIYDMFVITNSMINRNWFGDISICDKKEILIRPSGMVPTWTFYIKQGFVECETTN